MKKLLYLLFILNINIIVYSREYSFGFLKLPVSARQASLQAYSALSDDSGGIFYNPAGLTNILIPYVGFTHTEHFQNIKYENFSYIHPFRKNKVLFFGVSVLYTTNIEGRRGIEDEQPEYVNLYQVVKPEFYYNFYDVQTSVGVSRIIYNNISVGYGMKFLYEKIYDVSGYTVATDFGLQWYPEKIKFIGETRGLTCSLSVNNLGVPVKFVKQYYSLPTSCVIGISYKSFIVGRNTVFVLDYVLPVYDPSYLLSGVEIWVNEYILFRCGYKSNTDKRYLDDPFSGLSLGTGIDYFGIKLDYSLTSFGVLGYMHKISVSLEIDKIGQFYKFLRRKLFSGK